MLTYSINIGTILETSSLESLNDVLSGLPNNTSRLINPRDVRDAIYTTWTNNIFKPTTVTSSTIEYIGIDDSPIGISIKEKVFLGKRRLSGKDIMDNSLLNSDTDVFVFNTHLDSGLQNTKVSFLSGPSSSLYGVAPYVESTHVPISSHIDLNINNPSGNINITSSNKQVSVNGVIFPSVSESIITPNGYTLKRMEYGGKIYAEWQPIGAANIDTIFSSGTVSITGSPVIINGSSIEFSNAKPILSAIGGISIGTTFSNDPIVSVLNRLLYPHIPPSLSMVLSVTSSSSLNGDLTKNVAAEINSILSIRYKYNIVNKSLPVTSVLSSPGGSLPPTPLRLSGTSSISIPISGTTIYELNVTDGYATASATASLSYVHPYFWTISPNMINFGSLGSLSGLNKIVQTKSNTTIMISGTNSHIYFLYPSIYGDLTHIIDESLGWNFISSFTKSVSSLTSSSPYWSTNYNVYTYTAGGGTTTVNSNWTFK